MPETRDTFCRICEASCGLKVTVDDNRIIAIEPNRDHIGTLGFSCMKGLHQHEMYDSEDRLRYPLKKVNGEFQRISWDQANREIGAKVKELKRDNPNSIGMYVGTAAGFSLLHPIFAEGFMQGLGSHSIYSSATQDCANRFAAATEMYGFPFFQPFPDLDNVNCLLIVGTNPVVSKWTFLQVAHPVKRLKSILKRGGEIVVVDPRYTETAKVAGQHQFIRPNSDVFFFLSFLHEVFHCGAANRELMAQHMAEGEALETLVAAWPPERTAAVTGINADELRALVQKFIHADGAAIVTGTGIGMGQHGTLAHWLAECITAVTGNLDRRGGTLVGEGIFDFPALAQKQNLFNREAVSRIGGFRELNGGFPGGIMADEILTPGDGQLKALFVTGGNPLMTMANSARLRGAFRSLEMLVVTDIYLNETATEADYVLPATSPLERYDLPFVFPLFLGMQSIPYLAATEPVIEADAEQRDEASIYTDIATASGVNLYGSAFLQGLFRLMKGVHQLLGGKGLPQRFILDGVLRLSGAPRFKALLDQPNGLKTGGAVPDSFLGKRPLTPGARIQLSTPALLTEAAALTEYFAQLNEERDQYRMITRRAHASHNSWTHNIPALTNGKYAQTNFMYMHPEDAAHDNIEEGAAVDIATETHRIRLPVRFLPELSRGVVAVPHGWGHQVAAGLTTASRLSGANVNLLAADGADKIERISGMAHLTGIPVTLTSAHEPINPDAWDGIGEEDNHAQTEHRGA